MSVSDLSCSTALRLKPLPPYDFSLTVHKPAGWSLLTPFETFEGGTLWTVMRTPSRRIFGLKLRTVGTVKKPEVDCEGGKQTRHASLGVSADQTYSGVGDGC